MSGSLSIVLWLGLVGIAAMQWGAARAADLLDILRGHWSLPATAGGALMGLATASPEIAVNVTSMVFGWLDLGLRTALGSNVAALPLGPVREQVNRLSGGVGLLWCATERV